MNRTFEKTLGVLSKRQAELERIHTAKKALETGKGLVYEVHFQTYWPDHYSIMAEGEVFHATLAKAKELWRNYNGKSKRPGSGGAEVFVRIGGLRIAIMPEDADRILRAEIGDVANREHFTLDNRTVKAGLIFDESQKDLPSAWYTTTPTPPFEEKMEPAAVLA